MWSRLASVVRDRLVLAWLAGAAVWLGWLISLGLGGWTQDAYVKPFNTNANDYFGWRVALSADGDTLAVSAIWEDAGTTGVGGNPLDNSAPDAGAVYVFEFDPFEGWAQQAYIKPSNTGEGDNFGTSRATWKVGPGSGAGSADLQFVTATTNTYYGKPTTVGALPAGVAGDRAFVTDANATTFNSVVAGGGANKVPVFSDGANWRIG